jgi:hypothetical protein
VRELVDADRRLPEAEQTGRLDLRPQSMAIRIEHDGSGKVTGVVYADAPTLTIVVLALRQADHIEEQAKAGAL